MLAMELSGSAIGQVVDISWHKKYARHYGRKGLNLITGALISEIHHYKDGDVKIDWSHRRFPPDAVVTIR